MQFNNLILETKDRVAIVTINRPKVMNALNVETLEELRTVFNEAISPETRAVLITGVEKSFVAGADLKAMNQMSPQESHKFSVLGQTVFQSIETYRCPVIAVVNGYALGGGCELALACDIRLASTKAKLGQPEVNLGIIPGFGGTQRLPRLVGPGKAKEIIYTGLPVSAEEALRIGLVEAVYEPEQLMEKALEMANVIATRGPIAVALCKQAINMGCNMDINRGLELETHLFAQGFASEDRKEGVSAFVEKREANFQGK